MSDTTLVTADTTTDEAASQTADKPTDQSVDTSVQQAADDKAKEAPADDAKPEGEQEKTEGDKDEDKPQGAPENYEDFTVPEGVELDAEVTAEFKEVAKELNLPQEAAQKVTDLGVKLAQKWATQQTEATQAVLDGWRTAAETDKEFGGEKLAESLSVAKQVVDKFGTPEFRAMLDEYRMGDHPEFIRFALRVGKAISEDTHVAPGTATPPKDRAKTLFPNMN